jgi:hypothetical protein
MYFLLLHTTIALAKELKSFSEHDTSHPVMQDTCFNTFFSNQCLRLQSIANAARETLSNLFTNAKPCSFPTYMYILGNLEASIGGGRFVFFVVINGLMV